MIRIFVADDHAMLRDALAARLASVPDFAVVGEAGTVGELFERLPATDAQVLLLDVRMPGPPVGETLARMRSEFPHVAILVVSGFPEETYAARVIRMGALGFLNKEHSIEQLALAVRTVARGEPFVTEQQAAGLARTLRDQGAAPPELSERELEVLQALAAGESLKQTAGRLDISPKTVSTYRARLAEKLGAKSTAELIRYAIDRGLLPG
ncbi:MAG: response regulator transcription factor [Gemmatimonadetes bacterium]|nr:response regulator transcription factor [Gemmatimonadota bacterium]